MHGTHGLAIDHESMMEQLRWIVARTTVTFVDNAQLSPPMILSHTDKVILAVILIAIVCIAAMSQNPPWRGVEWSGRPRNPATSYTDLPVTLSLA
jgi:hypothetical protein